MRARVRHVDSGCGAPLAGVAFPARICGGALMFGSIVPPGTIVRTKVALSGAARGASAIMLFTNGSYCRILVNGGVAHPARREVTVPKKTLFGFIPMRLRLPYGRWVEEDGTMVLFSRDYCPLWKMLPSGEV